VLISDEKVTSLRAFLANDPDDDMGLARLRVESGDVDGYGELLYAAFVMAVQRRFAPTWTVPEVIQFVATVRADLLQDGIDIDPRTAETLIRRALGNGIASRLEERVSVQAQIFLLGRLIDDEELDGAELDAFLAEARSLANRLMN
jgi:hypothetical protein